MAKLKTANDVRNAKKKEEMRTETAAAAVEQQNCNLTSKRMIC